MTLVVNLVRTVSLAKFICCCWRIPWCDCHVTHRNVMSQPKYGQIINCGLTILTASLFSCTAYELRHGLDQALLTKWPVFLQNAFGNPTYVNQTNLNGKLRKKHWGPNGAPSKNLGGGHGPRRPPFRISPACEALGSLQIDDASPPPNWPVSATAYIYLFLPLIYLDWRCRMAKSISIK